MANDKLVKFLETKLSKSITNITSPRERRVVAETNASDLLKIMKALKDWGMISVGTITGLDSGANFEIIYHMYDASGLVLNLKVFIPREKPEIASITTVYPSVFLYERELMDLLGIVVNGTPPGRRYPLPENWPDGQYPLRKDWKGLPAEEGVTK